MFWFCGDRWSRRLLSKSCFHIYWNSQSEKSPPAASGLPSGLEAAVPASSSQNLLWCLNLLSCWKRRRAKSFIFNFSFSISMFLLRAHAAFRSRGTRWGWLSINRKLLNNILSHFCKTKITKWSWFNWLVEKKLYSLINNLNIHLIPMRLKSWTVIFFPPPLYLNAASGLHFEPATFVCPEFRLSGWEEFREPVRLNSGPSSPARRLRRFWTERRRGFMFCTDVLMFFFFFFFVCFSCGGDGVMWWWGHVTAWGFSKDIPLFLRGGQTDFLTVFKF